MQDVVFGYPVEDMDPAVVEESGLRDDPLRPGRADLALGHWLFLELLHNLKAVSLSAFVFVERHDDGRYHTQRRVVEEEG